MFLVIILLFHLSAVLGLRLPFWPQQTVLSSSNVAGEKGQEDQGWIDPRFNGGRFLDWSWGDLGEPLNVIISANSDPYILQEDGFRAYSKSIGFSSECLGLHIGDLHKANLGDGNGNQTEQYLARQYSFPITKFPGPVMGTCWESFAGGHHFRAWKQNGTEANTGAWFLAVSKEEHSAKNHKIVPDGYNLGRDWLVERAILGTRWNGMWWIADVEYKEGLLEKGKKGVMHGIEQDGRVAILTVIRL